jgi:hypothetical protein
MPCADVREVQETSDLDTLWRLGLFSKQSMTRDHSIGDLCTGVLAISGLYYFL